MAELAGRNRLRLRELTAARVALQTTGHSLATIEQLAFQLDHARARDAVHRALDLTAFARQLQAEVLEAFAPGLPLLQLRSNAPDRATYLRRPDAGRSLHPESAAMLRPAGAELALIVADGLSALAVERHAILLLRTLLPALLASGITLAPFAIVEQGRVAIGDPLGAALGVDLTLVLLGERPGLSAPDSLGAYLTWRPGLGRTDADRNCVSNIRAGGLLPEAAAARLLWYIQQARARRLTGTALKQEGADDLSAGSEQVKLIG